MQLNNQQAMMVMKLLRLFFLLVAADFLFKWTVWKNVWLHDCISLWCEWLVKVKCGFSSYSAQVNRNNYNLIINVIELYSIMIFYNRNLSALFERNLKLIMKLDTILANYVNSPHIIPINSLEIIRIYINITKKT